MNNKIKGALLGTLASLAGVVLWVLFGAVFELIAGWAGAIIGVLFIIIYRKFNPDDKSPFQIILAVTLILVEIILAEIITVAVLAAMNNVSFSLALSSAEIQSAMVFDLIIGYVFSFAIFISYIVSIKRRAKMEKARILAEEKAELLRQQKAEQQAKQNAQNSEINSGAVIENSSMETATTKDTENTLIE